MSNPTAESSASGSHIFLPKGSLLKTKELPVDKASEVVQSYWRWHGNAVWDLFEAKVKGGHTRITPFDVLSLTALNARTSMAALTALWSAKDVRQEVERRLKAFRQEFDPEKEINAFPPNQMTKIAMTLGEVAELLEQVPSWKSTRVSKLLYRMAPRFVCIWDGGAARTAYPGSNDDTWSAWFQRVYEDVNRNAHALDVVRKRSKGRQVSLVRTWDILLWTLWTLDQ